EAGPELGTFDYIIAHGVYSWVPGEVREALLALVRRSLAPEGLAFVSYNALPGCHVRLLVREMVMHHLRGVEGFEARLGATREFLTLLIENTAEADPMAAAVQAQCRSMLERDPRVLFHDELGPIYEPFYLTDFLAAGARHGLQFVAEAEGVWWREELFPSSRGKAVRRLIGEDTAELHQYMDFLTARLFRQTILCRAEARLDRKVEHRRIRGLWASALAKPIDPEPDLDSLAPVRFELSSKVAISLSEPVLKRALFTLSQAWPQAVSVSSLADHPDVDEGLLQLFTGGHVDLSTGPAPMTTTPGERPLASPLARLHAEHPSGEFCGLDHNFVQIEDEQGRRFVKLLDGTRTRADLAAEMADAGPPGELAGRIAAYLDRLAHLGLLIA
ncbi:MAG: hypothetical protein JWQ97_1944, partial [Phenylobacterium sp.]|nr:hypothetical protein [Phenylobacterium sp.]